MKKYTNTGSKDTRSGFGAGMTELGQTNENVVALCGTSISEYQISLASRFCDNIVLLMDGDEPGFIASTKAAEKITELGLNAIQIFLPPGMDPDDFARENDVDFLDTKIQEMIESKKTKLYIRVNNG